MLISGEWGWGNKNPAEAGFSCETPFMMMNYSLLALLFADDRCTFDHE